MKSKSDFITNDSLYKLLHLKMLGKRSHVSWRRLSLNCRKSEDHLSWLPPVININVWYKNTRETQKQKQRRAVQQINKCSELEYKLTGWNVRFQPRVRLAATDWEISRGPRGRRWGAACRVDLRCAEECCWAGEEPSCTTALELSASRSVTADDIFDLARTTAAHQQRQSDALSALEFPLLLDAFYVLAVFVHSRIVQTSCTTLQDRNKKNLFRSQSCCTMEFVTWICCVIYKCSDVWIQTG